MKRFLLRTLLFLSPFMAALAYYLFLVDKDAMRGDLGRLSQTQFHYDKPQLDTINMAPCRDVAIDEIAPLAEDEIVLFGDSFTAVSHWQQFMGNAWGKKIVASNDFLHPVDSYLSALTYCPNVLSDTVIIETVERYLVSRLCWLDFDNIAKPQPNEENGDNETACNWWRTNRMKPIEYYQRQVGIDVPVLTAVLDTPMFSCRPTKLYYFAEDTITYTKWEIVTARANLRKLDSLSRAKGKTLFIVAIPDKYTAYHKHIVGDDSSGRLLEAPCQFDSLPYFINTLLIIDSLIGKGVADVYLPDDTHFSAPTAKAIGEYVARKLTSQQP